MKKSRKILPINQIICKEKFYPRTHRDWLTVLRYKNAMDTGASFPMITAALYKKQFVLVDGWHRLEARRQRKEKFVETEILTGMNEKSIYVEAVKRNMVHGRQLSIQEKTIIAVRLKDLKITDKDISKLIRIPLNKMTKVIGSRMVRVNSEPVVVKAPLKHLSGQDFTSKEFEEEKQQVFGGVKSQDQIVDEFIQLLKSGWIDYANPKIRAKMVEIYKLLGVYMRKKSKKK